MEKEAIRKEMNLLRVKQATKEGKRKSKKIARSLFSLKESKDAKRICLYLSIKDEVDTYSILKRLLEQRKAIYLPKVKGKELLLGEASQRLKKGRFGILEPEETLSRLPELDMVIVPGVAFDRQGRRLGWGGGFYDRFLARIRAETKKIGLAFSFQILEKIPESKKDKGMDIVVTEKEIIRCNP